MNARARLLRRGLQILRGQRRNLLFLLLGVGVAAVLAASPASAGEPAGIPGIDICPKTAPVSVAPMTGVAAFLGERPLHITTDDSPEHIWSTGGFAGLQRTSYDLGCAANPASYLKLATANANNEVANAFIGISSGATALTDSVDRRAWNPNWIVSFMGDFTKRASDVIAVQIVAPLLGIALIFTATLLLVKYRGGDMSSAAGSTAWALLVVAIVSLVLAAPLLAASSAQKAGAVAVSALNDGDSASDSQTNKIVMEVQYQSWLRRTFGTTESVAAKKYGPELLMSQRITWYELDVINAHPDTAALAMKTLREKKAQDFKDIAAKVKDTDPDAYLWLTGEKNAGGLTILEALYSLVANAFRLMVDLLLITCTIMLAILGMWWLAGSPWLVTPWGRVTGMGLLNNTARGVGYVITAAIGSWLFGVYSQTAMQPGQSAWWSLLLLLLGTFIFWTAIRPDRKMLSLATMGHVRGSGRLTSSILKKMLMFYVGGKIAGAAAGKVIADKNEAAEQRSEDYTSPSPPITYGSVDFDPVHHHAALPADTEYVDGEVIDDRVDANKGLPRGAYAQPQGTLRGLPAGQPIYQRDDGKIHDAEEVSFQPPPADSVGEVDVYQRPAATDPADEYVTCPWCDGRGCGHCDGDGTVPRWVRDEVTGNAYR